MGGGGGGVAIAKLGIKYLQKNISPLPKLVGASPLPPINPLELIM